MQTTIAICVPSYKRPDGLRRLLTALAQQHAPSGCEIQIVVIDNEASLLTRSICEENQSKIHSRLIYCCEARRGLSHVRNKAIEIARQFADFLVFIDDDEVPQDRWLEQLLATQKAYNADAVSGPVVPYFMSDVPQWIRAGRFFERERHKTGSYLNVTRTGNVLIKMSSIEHIGGFDDRYALTGGEDYEFFRRLHDSGGSIVWSNEAVVEEWLPRSRTRLTWLLKRAYRTGGTDARCASARKSRAWIMLRGTLRSGRGVWLLLVSVVRGKCQAVRALQRILFGVGMIVGASGHPYQEYRKVHPV